MKELTIEVTNNCANHCRHCSSCALYEWDLQGADDERSENEQIYELTKPEVITALEKNPDCEKIRFSGGEPFMHPLLLELLREARNRKRYVEVLTSGVHHNEGALSVALLQCAKPFLDNINLSLYGDAEIHNEVTGNYESYECLDETVNRIIEQQIPFSFIFVAMQTSGEGLEEVFSYASQKRLLANYCSPSVSLFRFIGQGNGVCHKDFVLSRKELDEIRVHAEEFSKKYGIEAKFGCSFSERGCRFEEGKKVLTYRGKYIACSSLKDFEGEAMPGSFPCRERW